MKVKKNAENQKSIITKKLSQKTTILEQINSLNKEMLLQMNKEQLDQINKIYWNSQLNMNQIEFENIRSEC